MSKIIELSNKRRPVTYTVTITHHWDDALEVFVHDVADDERSRASVADSLRRASLMFGHIDPIAKKVVEKCAELALSVAVPMDGAKNKAQAEYIKGIVARKIADLATDPEAVAKIMEGR